MSREKNFFAITADEFQALRAKWQNLAAPFSGFATSAGALFHRLVESYSEPQRAYHNLSHIKALLRQAEAYENVIDNLQAVGFAVWFHDAIYNTRENDNEERSAELARQSLAE